MLDEKFPFFMRPLSGVWGHIVLGTDPVGVGGKHLSALYLEYPLEYFDDTW